MEHLRRFKRANIAPEKLDERLKANLRSLEIVHDDLTELLDNYYLPPDALDATYRARKAAGCGARSLEVATLAADSNSNGPGSPEPRRYPLRRLPGSPA